jgi:transcription elongation factor Elf1
MKRKNHNLEDFICVLSFQHKHYVQEPVMLFCGHAACGSCIDDVKKNTGLEKVKCMKCSKENNLESDYHESDLMNNYMNDNYDKILETLKNEFEETLKKAKS